MIMIVIIKDIIILDHVMCFQAVDAKSIRVVITLGRQTSLWSLLADTLKMKMKNSYLKKNIWKDIWRCN